MPNTGTVTALLDMRLPIFELHLAIKLLSYRSINKKNIATILQNPQRAFNTLTQLGFVNSSDNARLIYQDPSNLPLNYWQRKILDAYGSTNNISAKLFDLACHKLLFKNIKIKYSNINYLTHICHCGVFICESLDAYKDETITMSTTVNTTGGAEGTGTPGR